jgi:hypothetical protein
MILHLEYLLVCFAILKLARCYPIGPSSFSPAPIPESSDVWATIIANVAPIMALVGERNAKEYMRSAASRHQFLPLATAPLGILSIMIGAIRLSGSGFLRRLIGRESERRSEALVELTPLSVEPATSVWTPRAVEILPHYDRDGVAFVCGHVRKIAGIEAVRGFGELTSLLNGRAADDRDRELVLAIWRTGLTLD